MKRAILYVFGIIILIAAAAAVRDRAYSDTGGMTFRGIVVFVGDSLIEVKHGDAEMTFTLGQETVVARPGGQAAAGDLRVCQAVLVSYEGGDGNRALRVDIVRESYCVR